MKRLFFLIFLTVSMLQAQVTGLAGWNLFVDPGHSQHENMGVNGYSEAEEVLQTALNLRQLLLTKTDIDTVWSSRYTDSDQVSLTERTNDANARGAAWYHSIHSNAGSPNSNNVLLLWGELSNGTPDPPVGGEAMSDIMVELLADVMRIPQLYSIGDCSFYGCTFNGPYLHVNRETNMPSELSEQGFHTNPIQNQLDMNDDYTRLMAYSMFWTVLDKFGITRPFPGILSGIITDTETGLGVNGASITVNGETYVTDTYESLFHQYSSDPDEFHNGFYFFEDLPDSSFEVIVSCDGYYPDTLQVNGLASDFATFRDVMLVPDTPPVVVASSPNPNQSDYPAWNIPYFDFSRSMDHTTTEAAFSISPLVTGTFLFSPDSKRMAFVPDDTLAFVTEYSITIAGTAMDTYGHPLDGNMDGIGGDDWTITFTTSPPDLSPPTITETYPGNGASAVDLLPVVNIVWNEELDPASISESLVILDRISDLSVQNTTLEHYVVGGKSVLVLYALDNLLDNEAYRVRVFSGFADLFGNIQTSTSLIQFTTSDFNYTISSIDNFETNLLTSWWEIQQSGSNAGILTAECSRTASADHTMTSTNSAQSLRINYGWDTSASSWLIREYLAPGSAGRNTHFTANRIMQAFIFGDGLGNKFRFCVDDNIGSNGAHEVSPWFVIDWVGWRLISWDMSVDGTGTWIGDGNLDGTLEFDSIQLGYTPGQPNIGTYYIDDLRVVNRNYLALDDDPLQVPSETAILPNYPNPFNPWTMIPFTLAKTGEIRVSIFNLKGELITTLLSGKFEAGSHVTRWNASALSSGLYLVSLETNHDVMTRKITVLK